MMEPFLVRNGSRISVSNILTASGKRFEDLSKLDEFPGGVCWLNSLAICPYGPNCSFIAGHVPKGTLTDAHADQVVETLQGGITDVDDAALWWVSLGKKEAARRAGMWRWKAFSTAIGTYSDVTGYPSCIGGGGNKCCQSFKDQGNIRVQRIRQHRTNLLQKYYTTRTRQYDGKHSAIWGR